MAMSCELCQLTGHILETRRSSACLIATRRDSMDEKTPLERKASLLGLRLAMEPRRGLPEKHGIYDIFISYAGDPIPL